MIRTAYPAAPASTRGSVVTKALCVALLAFAGAAQAAVITFEGQSGTVSNQQSIQEAGYKITFFSPLDAPPNPAAPGTIPIGRFVDGSNLAATCTGAVCPTNNPTTFLDLYSSGYVDISANAGGTPFTLSGFDASFIGMPGVSYPNPPGQIQVIGFIDENTSLTRTFNLGPQVNGEFSFMPFALDAAFAQQQFVEVAIFGLTCDANGSCVGLDSGSGQYGLDNIVLSDQPTNNVPEPASAALLAIGLLGLRSRRRA